MEATAPAPAPATAPAAIEALGPTILVWRDEAVAESPGGILLPESAKQKPRQGTIMSIGGTVDPALGLRVGDRIVFSAYAGTVLEKPFDGFILMRGEDALGREIAAGTVPTEEPPA